MEISINQQHCRQQTCCVESQKTCCSEMIAALNMELGWGLSQQQQHAYVSSILQYLPSPCSETKLRRLIIAYYDNHHLVEALSQPNHEQHLEAWQQWRTQVTAILHHANLHWSSDSSVDWEDILQVACIELARALPSFRYASHFPTWARRVVVQRAQRYMRDSLALKRSHRPESLEESLQTNGIMTHAESPVTCVETRLLVEAIGQILLSQPDSRLVKIFHLWVIHDKRVEDIGKTLHIHPTRVRQLLEQIRHILSEHPDIQIWMEEIGGYEYQSG